MEFNQIGNLYPLEVNFSTKQSNALVTTKTPIKDTITWHNCMGHLHQQALFEMSSKSGMV
jgi:hypothetical protein